MKALDFRTFLESSRYCGLQLSPLLAAIADASEGVEPVLSDTLCLQHFGCPRSGIPRRAPRVVVVRAGGRGGKTSRLLAPKAVHAAWTVPLPTLRPGEEAVAVLVAPDLKLARQALSFVRGYVAESRVLSAAVHHQTDDYVSLRRPDGRVVRIEILAASRGGRSLRGRTLVFAGLDEAAFFLDESTGVVNDQELYRAVVQRVVPGGQVWVVSTPWAAGVGLLESLVEKNLGHHGFALAVVAGTRALNPTWDPDGEIERHMRDEDPANAAREIDAEPLAGGAGNFLDPRAVDRCALDDVAVPADAVLGAAIDAAFRRDSAAVAIVARVDDVFALVHFDEIRPRKGEPLKPSAVCASFAASLSSFGVRRAMADIHYIETVREELAKSRILVDDAPLGQARLDMYQHARRVIHEGRFGYPKNASRVPGQLKELVSKATAGGGMTIGSRRRGDGHADVAVAIITAVWAAEQASSGTLAISTGGKRDTSNLDQYAGGGLRGRWAGW